MEILYYFFYIFERRRKSGQHDNHLKIYNKHYFENHEFTYTKKVNYEIKLRVNETNAKIIDDKVMVHLDVDAELEKGELLKMLKNIGV